MHIVNENTCPYCTLCGGCDFVGIRYEETLKLKFNDFKKLTLIDDVKIVPSPSPVNYRTRCQLQVVNGKAGFFKKKSHDHIEIKNCLLLDERLNNKIQNIKLPNNYNGKIELYIKDGVVCERIVEKKYDNMFIQVNEGMNKLLVKEAVSLLDLKPNDNILELYCGNGNFTHAILDAEPKAKMVGIDLKIETGKRTGVEFIEADVEKGISNLNNQRRLACFNKLLLDPPRAGVSKKALDILKTHNFEKIIYVSCSPESFTRDAKILVEAGYKLSSTKLFDMFPFTKYIETVSVLTK